MPIDSRTAGVFSVLFLIFQRQNCSPRQRCTKASTPRFIPSKVHGCPFIPEEGHTALTEAVTGLCGFDCSARRRQMVIGR